MNQEKQRNIAAFIYPEQIVREKLSEPLSKAKMLITLALESDFLNQKKFLMHDYLCALSDLIEEACDLNE